MAKGGLRRAAVAAAEPFGLSRRGALLVYAATFAVPLVLQLALGVGALSIGVSLAIPVVLFLLLLGWSYSVSEPHERIRELELALRRATEAHSEAVELLNGQLEEARHLRAAMDAQPPALHQMALAHDLSIDAWIEATAQVLGRFAPAEVAGFRADTGQYDKAFDWTVEGMVDSQVEYKNRRLRRLDRHIQRLVEIIGRIRDRATQQG